MNDPRQEIEISVRNVNTADIDFAWPIYRDFIKANIFSSRKDAEIADKWNEMAERDRFSERWNADDCYIVEIDGVCAGWISTERSDRTLTVENIFLAEAWQNKGIATRIITEMMPTWEEEKILLNIPVLKNAALSEEIENALHKLGFKSRGEDAMTNIYGKDWR